MESAQNRGYFAPQGCLLTPGLRVASDRPTGGAHDWLKLAAGRVTGSGLRTRKSLIRLDFIERKHPLEKDAPEPRRIESPAMGKVSAIPKVGGLITIALDALLEPTRSEWLPDFAPAYTSTPE